MNQFAMVSYGWTQTQAACTALPSLTTVALPIRVLGNEPKRLLAKEFLAQKAIKF